MNLQERRIDGLTFNVRPDTVDTWILHEVIAADYYAVRVIRERWDSLSTIIDVGAHIGAFTVWCKKLWPQAEIFAIEASPENFEILQLNAEHLHGVHLLHRALWGMTGVSRASRRSRTCDARIQSGLIIREVYRSVTPAQRSFPPCGCRTLSESSSAWT